MLLFLVFTASYAQLQKLTASYALQNGVIKPSLAALFNEKFTCFQDIGAGDERGVYAPYFEQVYSDGAGSGWVCCGLMANGRRQCDRMEEWRQVGDSRFSLCELNYEDALDTSNNRMRRDLCCQNDEFNDCGLCAGFMVWDFTSVAEDGKYYGGDNILESNLAAGEGVTLSDQWRDSFKRQPSPEIVVPGQNVPISYPPYAYENQVFPGGFHLGTLREYNDPPVCVYAPQVAGRVIEVKVEPEEAGSQVCVDDLKEDSLSRNDPGVTQSCDDSKLQTCFPDATPDDSITGFAFLISCSESCADGPVDLWFRVRASVMKWTDAGNEELGTDRTEVNTEMWCMWGNQDMRDSAGNANFPDAFPQLDGDFSKWDVFPSDLAEEEEARIRPVQDGVSMIALTSVLAMLALLF